MYCDGGLLMIKIQKGLTLIELMISMVLGLLISAAAVKLFSTGINAYRLQSSVTDLQDTAVFGLDYMADQTYMANLGAIEPMNLNTSWTGIVFTGSKSINSGKDTVGNLRGTDVTDTDNLFLTIGGDEGITAATSASDGWMGLSNIKDTNSDQLVIQYRVPYDIKPCENIGDKSINGQYYVAGPAYDATSKTYQDGRMVLQRFFLREDSSGLALACDAGYYTPADGAKVVAPNASPTTGYKTEGTILMRGVDHFRVNLGIKLANGIKYLSIKDYKALASKPNIEAIQLAVLARGTDDVSKNYVPDEKYDLLDQTNLEAKTDKGYVRRVYTHTIQLRNQGGTS